MSARLFVHNGIYNGTAASGCKCYTYTLGTVVPKTTYYDIGLSVVNTNPVIGNSDGYVRIFFDSAESYTFVIKTSDDAHTLLEAEFDSGTDVFTVTNADVDNWNALQDALASVDNDLLAILLGAEPYDTLADLMAADGTQFEAGTILRTKGHQTAMDGCGAYYVVYDTLPKLSDGSTSITVDSAGLVNAMTGGNWAINQQYLVEGVVTPKMYGLKGNSTDEATLLAAYLAKLNMDAQASETLSYAQRPGKIPPGRYKSTAGTTLTTTGYGVAITGEGFLSQLENTEFAPEYPFWELRNLTLRAATAASDPCSAAITLDSTPGAGRASNIFLQNRAVGIYSADATSTCGFYNIDALRNDIALKVDDSGGIDIGGFDFNSGRIGFEFNGGGEIKLNHGRMLSNTEYGQKMVGTVSNIPIESYYHNVTLTGNGVEARSFTVSSIATYNAGTQIEVTLSGTHNLNRGFPKINLHGTGVVGYDDVETYVVAVTASNKVVLDLAYVSNATGTLLADGWDLWLESQGAPQYVRDHWWIGGNINTTYISGGHNLNFIGTRLKSQIWLDNTQQVNRLFFLRNGMGTYAGGDATATSVERNKDIPVAGPGSLLGWGEMGMFIPGTPSGWGAATGELAVGMRSPYYAGGLATTNEPNHLNHILSYDNKLSLKSNGWEITQVGNIATIVARNAVSISRTSNVTTVTLDSPPGLTVNGLVTISGTADATFNGNFAVASVSGNTFTYANTGSNGSSTGAVVTPVFRSANSIQTSSFFIVGPYNDGANATVFQTNNIRFRSSSTSYVVAENATGNIAIVTGDVVGGGSAVTHMTFDPSAGIKSQSFLPIANNTHNLGSASSQSWKDIYTQNAVTVTSDERTKQQVGPFPDAWLDAWAGVQWVRYKLNTAVEQKGADKARWHCGVIAQQVYKAFADKGIDAFQIGILGYDEWPERIERTEVADRGPNGELRYDDDGILILKTVETVIPAGNEWKVRYGEAEAIEAAFQRRRLDRIEAMLSGQPPAPPPPAVPPAVPDELAQRRRQVSKLKAEIDALKKQLADANHDNDALKDRIGELESELAKANEPPPLLPDPATSMLEFDESFKPLRGLMEDGETVSMAKKRLYPRLMEELQDLKNKEALFNTSLPRRAEVEQLLGILARVGEH